MRKQKLYKCFGRELTLREWSKETGLPVGTIRQRIYLSMWPMEKILTAPSAKTSLAEWFYMEMKKK